ncbi:hypothetical protein DVK85_05360 [Flavobacterium arcticum]|uniref:Glycosyltransferase RgtA/B/C/D-like domain-containing protein n=1 Tax=Flavobacterium arcticum TaxID=1784713 RepID=A0A345HAS8_9FLAO|nr:glucosyltransferase domain-containing protein [Flavobacterium arcticum]AXG73688.1 hypothetical protein DVK85_05360 [Flavobacterium arcticum]KAF2511639.1 hypothetical protein E0W72_04870 [Flavobacterium arcticum]
MSKTISSEYFKLLFFSIVISFIAYGFALTNFSLTIDSEQVFLPDTSLALGRWGTNILRYHIFEGIIPYFTLLLSLILLSLSAVEIAQLFRLNNLMGYIFCGLFLTFPQMAYQLVFTMQADVVALGFLTSALSIKFFIKSLEGSLNLKSASYFTFSSLFFMFVIALYQALAFIPIIIYIIILFQNTSSENYNFKTEFKKGLLFIGLMITSVILYFISVKIICPNGDGSGFLANYTQGDKNLFVNFYEIWIANIKGSSYYGNKTFLISSIICVLLIINLFFGERKNRPIRSFLLLLMMVIPFIISFFITSGYNPPRIYVTEGIVFAFIIVSFLSMIKKAKISLIFSSLIMLTNIYFITMLFWSNHKLYNHDINIARNIDNSIRAKYPNFDPTSEYVYFFGSLPYGEHEKFRLPNSEIFGGSFFIWDGGSNDRIISFMKFSDVASYRKIDNKETYTKIKDSINSMPTWPKSGYIKRIDDVIIVKLGDKKGAKLWVE